MKTKYVKVPVSERLPEKRGRYLCRVNGYSNYEYYDYDGEKFNTSFEIEEYLIKVPDHSEEMLSMLEEVNKLDKSMFSDKFNTDDFKRKLNRLINKVKDNGNRL